MPIKQEILEDGWIVYVKYTDPWTLADLNSQFAEDQAYRDSVPHTVHALVDVGSVKTVPLGVLKARYSPSFLHPRHGQVIGVVSNSYIRLLAITVSQLIQFEDVLLFENLDDALAHLRRVTAHGAQADPGDSP